MQRTGCLFFLRNDLSCDSYAFADCKTYTLKTSESESSFDSAWSFEMIEG